MEVTARSSDPETAKKIADTMAVVSAQYIKEKMEVAPPKIIEEAEVPSSPVSPSMNKKRYDGRAGRICSCGGDRDFVCDHE